MGRRHRLQAQEAAWLIHCRPGECSGIEGGGGCRGQVMQGGELRGRGGNRRGMQRRRAMRGGWGIHSHEGAHPGRGEATLEELRCRRSVLSLGDGRCACTRSRAAVSHMHRRGRLAWAQHKAPVPRVPLIAGAECQQAPVRRVCRLEGIRHAALMRNSRQAVGCSVCLHCRRSAGETPHEVQLQAA